MNLRLSLGLGLVASCRNRTVCTWTNFWSLSVLNGSVQPFDRSRVSVVKLSAAEPEAMPGVGTFSIGEVAIMPATSKPSKKPQARPCPPSAAKHPNRS